MGDGEDVQVVYASGHADDNFLLLSSNLVDDLLSFAFVKLYNNRVTMSQNLRYWGPVSGKCTDYHWYYVSVRLSR